MGYKSIKLMLLSDYLRFLIDLYGYNLSHIHIY